MNIQHVYKTSYYTALAPPGFADFILGTMSLHFITGGQLYVSYKNHPICLYLHNTVSKSPANDFKGEVVELFNIPCGNVVEYCNSVKTPTNVVTNTKNYALSEELKEFITKTFLPKPYLQREINKKIKELKLDDFETIHVRLGDSIMQHDVDRFHQLIDGTFKEKFADKNIFLTADNADIKDYICSKLPNVKIFKNKPIHLGNLQSSTIESIRDTLIDFFVMAKTNKVHCYSVYGGSGFSYCCSQLFNFPYTVIKI